MGTKPSKPLAQLAPAGAVGLGRLQEGVSAARLVDGATGRLGRGVKVGWAPVRRWSARQEVLARAVPAEEQRRAGMDGTGLEVASVQSGPPLRRRSAWPKA